MKKTITSLLFGLLATILWSFAFLDHPNTTSLSAFMGFLCTIGGSYLLQKEHDFQLNLKEKIATLAIPLIYTAAFLKNDVIYRDLNNLKPSILLNPILLSFTILLFSILFSTQLFKKANPWILYLSAFLFFYSYGYFDEWKATQYLNLTEKFVEDRDIDNSVADSLTDTSTDINIHNFRFINRNLDTISIQPEGKFILIETWNESCVPCIMAMKELPSYYRLISDRVKIFYVYENNNEKARNVFGKIFSFKHIYDHSKIMIDLDQNFYNSLSMKGFPYFVLFDKQGNLLFMKRGYRGRKELSKTINKFID
ncbi:MAG: hypothetical protein D6732_04535 [Methanobacteriota archaeon]|nr:MAG: hypothetical protein D6732_04535 [Euryarchaeota archaeon]